MLPTFRCTVPVIATAPLTTPRLVVVVAAIMSDPIRLCCAFIFCSVHTYTHRDTHLPLPFPTWMVRDRKSLAPFLHHGQEGPLPCHRHQHRSSSFLPLSRCSCRCCCCCRGCCGRLGCWWCCSCIATKQVFAVANTVMFAVLCGTRGRIFARVVVLAFSRIKFRRAIQSTECWCCGVPSRICTRDCVVIPDSGFCSSKTFLFEHPKCRKLGAPEQNQHPFMSNHSTLCILQMEREPNDGRTIHRKGKRSNHDGRSRRCFSPRSSDQRD